jgi:hypothetical protein
LFDNDLSRIVHVLPYWFPVKGEVMGDMWQTVKTELAQEAAQSLNATCNQERVYSG